MQKLRPPWRHPPLIKLFSLDLLQPLFLSRTGTNEKETRILPSISSVLFFFFPFSLSWHDIESRPNNRGSNEGFSRSKKKSKSQVLSRMDLDLDHAIHSFFGNKPPAHRCPVSHVRELRKKYRGRQTMEEQANEDDISAYNITVESRIS